MINPWMSMWLSTFNRAANTARGHASAQATRQYQAMVTEGTRQFVRLWAAGFLTPPVKKPTRRRKAKR